ncbi:MAG: antitoxin Xre/MbcA/ParS toxin-binding domain-containing protein [Chthoniobacteraceae bacterium]
MKLGEKTSKAVAKGLVNWHIHGTAKQSSKTFNPNDVVLLVNKGLPIAELEDLRIKLDLPMEKLAEKIGMSKSTLHRRKDTGRLETGESDRVLRLARLFGKAIDVLGSETEGRRWIMSKQFGLGGAIPLDYAETEVGAREVENLLTRIDYGVYS